MLKKAIAATSMSLLVSYTLSLILMLLMLKPVIIPLLIWLGMLTTYLPFFEVKSIEDFITSNASFAGMLVGVIGLYIFINSSYRFYKLISLKNHEGVKKSAETNVLKAFTIPINLMLWNTLFYFGLIAAVKPVLMYVVLIVNSATVFIAAKWFSGIEAITLISVNMFILFASLSIYLFLFLFTHIKIISPFLDKLNLFVMQKTTKYEPENDMNALLEKVNKYFEGRHLQHVSMPATYLRRYVMTVIRIPASLGNDAEFTLEYSSFEEFKDVFEAQVRNEASLFTRQSTKKMLSQNAGVRVELT